MTLQINFNNFYVLKDEYLENETSYREIESVLMVYGDFKRSRRFNSNQRNPKLTVI